MEGRMSGRFHSDSSNFTISNLKQTRNRQRLWLLYATLFMESTHLMMNLLLALPGFRLVNRRPYGDYVMDNARARFLFKSWEYQKNEATSVEWLVTFVILINEQTKIVQSIFRLLSVYFIGTKIFFFLWYLVHKSFISHKWSDEKRKQIV